MSKDLKKWMPLFWNDYFGGTQHFNNCSEHGAYLLLLAYCWNNGALPADDEIVRRIAKATPKQWNRFGALVRAKFDSLGRHHRVDLESSYAIEKSKAMSANAKQRHYNGSAKAHTPTPTPTKILKRETGFVAKPDTPEFVAWLDYATQAKPSLKRELEKRKIEGRSFDFAAQWPPDGKH